MEREVNIISGIDIDGKEVTGELIGTALNYAIIRYGEDRLNTTTISFKDIKSSEMKLKSLDLI